MSVDLIDLEAEAAEVEQLEAEPETPPALWDWRSDVAAAISEINHDASRLAEALASEHEFPQDEPWELIAPAFHAMWAASSEAARLRRSQRRDRRHYAEPDRAFDAAYDAWLASIEQLHAMPAP